MRDFLTIVTGLPRSGTSMMMKMLQSGGMEAMTDKLRTADEDNPKGYYEFEAVKRTKEDASWVRDSKGKAVKMVYSLVHDMPKDWPCRLLVMRRDMSEILASQRKMLKRNDNDDEVDDAIIGDLFNRQMKDFLQWLPSQPHLQFIEVSYNNIMSDPVNETRRIADFIGGLDADAMAAMVDPSLYRNRLASS